MGMGAPLATYDDSSGRSNAKTLEERKRQAAADAADQAQNNPFGAGKSNATAVVDNRRATPEAAAATDARNATKLDPTLTDLLLRDIATGQVRRTRAGARRATFGGSSMNPYDTPTLGG